MRDHRRKEVENHETLALERGASNTYGELQQWLKILTCFVEKVVVKVDKNANCHIFSLNV